MLKQWISFQLVAAVVDFLKCILGAALFFVESEETGAFKKKKKKKMSIFLFVQILHFTGYCVVWWWHPIRRTPFPSWKTGIRGAHLLVVYVLVILPLFLPLFMLRESLVGKLCSDCPLNRTSNLPLPWNTVLAGKMCQCLVTLISYQAVGLIEQITLASIGNCHMGDNHLVCLKL